MFAVKYIISLCTMMNYTELSCVISALKELQSAKTELTNEEKALILTNRYHALNGYSCRKYHYPKHIETIKMLRSRTGLGLKEAKEVTDAYLLEVDKID